VKKLIKSRKGRKKLDFLIALALILALLAISPAAASISGMQFSSSPDAVQASAQMCTKTLGVLGLEATLASNENFDPLKYIGQNIDIVYMLAGIVAAVLLGFIYTRMIRGDNEFIANLRKTLHSFKFRKITGIEEAVQEKVVPKEAVLEKVIPEKIVQEKVIQEKAVQEIAVQEIAVQEMAVPKKVIPEEAIPEKVVHKVSLPKKVIPEEVTVKQLKLYIAVPVLCIAIAELLIFFGRIEIAIYVHIAILFALCVSNIFIRDPKIHKIYMPLMLLPVLRIVNLSMPVFSKMTLYTFVLFYTPLAIPVAAIMISQRNSLKEMGITKKHLLPYMVLAVPLSFLIGLGEYLTIRPGYLIPDLSFENLLMLTFIMVFFVGLVEELIFRSLLQSRLEQALSMPEALLITSFLFGLMHSGYGTYYEMLYTGFVGLVIGFIFYKTRSLPFIAVLHGFVNVFLFGILPLHLIGLSWL
jgi:membrane protease YdiL (CAAX protease family)